MSILNTTFDEKLKIEERDITYQVSQYKETPDENRMAMLILKHFTLGDVTMQKPRVEFNDLSVLGRQQVDAMSFNTYQPNNGNPLAGDVVQSWKSHAMRPVVRNKVISIVGHLTARLISPKVFAFNQSSEVQEDAAKVMEYLMEWANDQSNYTFYSLQRAMAMAVEPASIGYTEYCEVVREDGELDETLSGFQDVAVPVNELYIENFYEPDIQKQGWLIWRRVQSYSLMQAKYGHMKNFKYVSPGVQLLYNDANQTFYQVYDTNMRQEDCEEIIYWNRSLNIKLIMVNRVLLTPWNNKNPRLDRKYPFDKFGFSFISPTNRCFYYKSLVFHASMDAAIINTLYPMIIDGTYLNLMPPMISVGGETIGSDVIVPGAVTTLSDPNADLRAINLSTNLKAGMDTLFKVEDSINQSTQDPVESGQTAGGSQTAYEISRIEQNAATVLGPVIKMFSDHVRQFGALRKGDILQHLTIADVDKITDQPDLVYKTFLLHSQNAKGKSKVRKVKFEQPPQVDPSEYGLPKDKTDLAYSFRALKMQKQEGDNVELYLANPELFRNLNFMITISPDVLNPMSEDLERAFNLETYDRAVQNPTVELEEITKDLLLSSAPATRRDPDKYLKKQDMTPQNPMQQIQMAMSGKQQSPLQSMSQPGFTQAPMAKTAAGQ